MPACAHLSRVRPVHAKTTGCEECLEEGTHWVELRQCMECGHVGCCDNSPGKHATKHFKHTGHVLMRSFQKGDEWGWCFADEVMLDFSDPLHPKLGEP